MHMIEVDRVDLICGGRAILREVNLCVGRGKCCALVGPNGSGKSTLLSVMAGYTWPTSGQVRVAGQVFGKVNLAEVRRHIGLIEPSRMPGFNERMALRELVATGFFGSIVIPIGAEIGPEQWSKVVAGIEALGLAGRERDVFAMLSTGEQMKALIARAMVSGANVLLLDEPTVGLDIGARAAFMKTLDELLSSPQSPTVVIVSHHLDELPLNVEAVVLMKDGAIFDAGRPEHVLTSEKLSILYGCDVHVFRRDGRYAASVGGA